jgi:hypothetical protein
MMEDANLRSNFDISITVLSDSRLCWLCTPPWVFYTHTQKPFSILHLAKMKHLFYSTSSFSFTIFAFFDALPHYRSLHSKMEDHVIATCIQRWRAIIAYFSYFNLKEDFIFVLLYFVITKNDNCNL